MLNTGPFPSLVVSTEKAAGRREESREEEKRKNRACEANSDSVYIHADFLSPERETGQRRGEKLEERRVPGEEMRRERV